MPLFGNRDQPSDAPKNAIDDKSTPGTDQFGNTVFAVDTTEAGVTPGVTHSGWVKVTRGTGGREGRVHYETLVATGSIQGDATVDANGAYVDASPTGDADDTTFPDA